MDSSMQSASSEIPNSSKLQNSSNEIRIGSANVPARLSQGIQKRQPWRAVWPMVGPERVRPMRYYGYKKGEKMCIPGNAGDFFAHGNWVVEYETKEATEKI